MSRLRVPVQLTGLLLSGGLAAGCATHAEPLTPVGTPALNAPEPPGRVVVPIIEEQTLPPTVEEPPAGGASAVTTKPPVRTPNPRPAAPPPADPPPPVPTPTPTILLTPQNTAAFEARIREKLHMARLNLGQIAWKELGNDAKAQFDAANGFIRQAEEALRVKNLIYAGQLADKAATMAALLRK